MSEVIEDQEPHAGLKSILFSLDDAVSAVDLTGTIIYWNHGSENLYGYRAAEVVGHSIEEKNPGPWGSRSAREALAVDPGSIAVAEETARIMKYGSTLTVSVRFSPLRDDAGEMVGLSAVSRDITKFRESELARADLTRRLLNLEDEISKKIVSDIHDGVLQELIANSLRLRMLMKNDESSKGANPLESIERSISNSIEQLRSIMFEVSPSALDFGGVLEALKEHFERLNDVSEETELVFENLPSPSLSPQNASTLYRIGREAITNSLKHAHATTIRVSIVEAYGGLQMYVADNGRGMPTRQSTSSHFGIQTMRDRAAQDGGHLDIVSDANSGTKVEVWIPLAG
jgi:PAS domain S-box-containing protein